MRYLNTNKALIKIAQDLDPNFIMGNDSCTKLMSRGTVCVFCEQYVQCRYFDLGIRTAIEYIQKGEKLV